MKSEPDILADKSNKDQSFQDTLTTIHKLLTQENKIELINILYKNNINLFLIVFRKNFCKFLMILLILDDCLQLLFFHHQQHKFYLNS